MRNAAARDHSSSSRTSLSSSVVICTERYRGEGRGGEDRGGEGRGEERVEGGERSEGRGERGEGGEGQEGRGRKEWRR